MCMASAGGEPLDGSRRLVVCMYAGEGEQARVVGGTIIQPGPAWLGWRMGGLPPGTLCFWSTPALLVVFHLILPSRADGAVEAAAHSM